MPSVVVLNEIDLTETEVVVVNNASTGRNGSAPFVLQGGLKY